MSQKRQEVKKSVIIVGEEIQPGQTIPGTTQDVSIPISFDDWWIQIQNKLNLKPELREPMRKHFSSRGFTDYKKFNDGLRDFGFKA